MAGHPGRLCLQLRGTSHEPSIHHGADTLLDPFDPEWLAGTWSVLARPVPAPGRRQRLSNQGPRERRTRAGSVDGLDGRAGRGTLCIAVCRNAGPEGILLDARSDSADRNVDFVALRLQQGSVLAPVQWVPQGVPGSGYQRRSGFRHVECRRQTQLRGVGIEH